MTSHSFLSTNNNQRGVSPLMRRTFISNKSQMQEHRSQSVKPNQKQRSISQVGQNVVIHQQQNLLNKTPYMYGKDSSSPFITIPSKVQTDSNDQNLSQHDITIDATQDQTNISFMNTTTNNNNDQNKSFYQQNLPNLETNANYNNTTTSLFYRTRSSITPQKNNKFRQTINSKSFIDPKHTHRTNSTLTKHEKTITISDLEEQQQLQSQPTQPDQFILNRQNTLHQAIISKRDSEPFKNQRLSKNHILINHQDESIAYYQEALKNKDFKTIIKPIQEMMSKAVDFNDIQLFTVLVGFISDLAQELKEYDYACFFYYQGVLFSTYTKNYELKAKCLFNIAYCAKNSLQYTQAIKILKKSLEYAWIINNEQLELNIYEEIGINFYRMSNLSQAYYYHNRSVQGLLENQNSPTKLYSKKSLQIYIDSILYTFDSLTSLLLTYLSLPLLSVDQLPQQCENQINYIEGQTPRYFYEQNKQNYYLLVNTEYVINQVINSNEFQTEIPAPNFPTMIENPFIEKNTRLKIEQNRIPQSYKLFAYNETNLKIVEQKYKRHYNKPLKFWQILDNRLQQKPFDPLEEELKRREFFKAKRKFAYITQKYKLYFPKVMYKQTFNQKISPFLNQHKNVYLNFIEQYYSSNSDNTNNQ